MKNIQKLLTGTVLAATIVLAGCAAGPTTQSGTADQIAHAGFLSDYSKLRPLEGADGTFRYIDSSANIRPYNKILIDPVQVFVTPNPDYKGVQPDTLKRMTDAFRMEFVGAMLSGYQVVEKPGADVLRVRLAITGVQPVKPDLGMTDLIPIKAVFNVARSAAGTASHVAEMSAEAEVLDANGRVVGAVVSTRKASKTLPQGEKITWADLQVIAATWAKGLRQQIDYARGYAPPAPN